jgi:hypothetical protein
MFDLRKLFVRDPSRRSSNANETEVQLSQAPGKGLEAEYESLILNQLQRWGITEPGITLEVRQLGKAPDGLEVYAGMVRLARWERDPALRMLLGLPLLETKIRRLVRSVWIGEVSHFGGLWLHASEQLHSTGAMGELRDLLRQVAPASTPAQPEDTFNGMSTGGHSVSALNPASTGTPTPGPAKGGGPSTD